MHLLSRSITVSIKQLESEVFCQLSGHPGMESLYDTGSPNAGLYKLTLISKPDTVLNWHVSYMYLYKQVICVEYLHESFLSMYLQ